MLCLFCPLASFFPGSSPVTQLSEETAAQQLCFLVLLLKKGRMGPECPASAKCDSIKSIYLFHFLRKDGILCQAGLCQIAANVMPFL